MGRAREITGVEMLSRTASTCPNNPIVEVSENGSDWTSVDYTGAYLYFVRRLLQDQGDTRFRLSFRPIKARYLRATLTRMDNLYPWSIAELEVLGGAGEGRTPTRERGG